MSFVQLEKKMIATARANPPSNHVPYAFEKRLMAQITTKPALDHWAFLARALWCGAFSCVAIMLLLSAWSFFAPANNSAQGDLSQDFESAVLAVVDQEGDRLW
jgi:hypothetical protein